MLRRFLFSSLWCHVVQEVVPDRIMVPSSSGSGSLRLGRQGQSGAYEHQDLLGWQSSSVSHNTWRLVTLLSCACQTTKIYFFVIQPTRCTNFTNLIWHETTCFRQFVCPSSGVYSLYLQQWYMSSRFVDSFQAGPAGPAWKLYDIYHCWMYSE
jgi:hypothetical protein